MRVIEWQEKDWTMGVSAALRRDEKGEPCVTAGEDAVTELINGATTVFALPLNRGR